MSNTDAQRRELAAALYLPAGQRVDCCARCRWSVPASGGKLACRQNRNAEVAYYSVCALWSPIARRIPCEQPEATMCQR